MTHWIFYAGISLIMVAATISACGKEEDAKDSKVRKAVEEVVTKDFKLYEGAKDKIKKATQAEEQRRKQEQGLP